MKKTISLIPLDAGRERLIPALRGRERTVNELAHELHLTDNAVRAHLLALQRARLVQVAGRRKGVRRDHVTYALTGKAEGFFPKAHEAVLAALVEVLAERLPPALIGEIVDEAGSRIAASLQPLEPTADLAERLDRAVAAMSAVGGLAMIERVGGKIVLQGLSCPLDCLASRFPAACKIAERIVNRSAGLVFRECCEKGAKPRCRFELLQAGA